MDLLQLSHKRRKHAVDTGLPWRPSVLQSVNEREKAGRSHSALWPASPALLSLLVLRTTVMATGEPDMTSDATANSARSQTDRESVRPSVQLMNTQCDFEGDP